MSKDSVFFTVHEPIMCIQLVSCYNFFKLLINKLREDASNFFLRLLDKVLSCLVLCGFFFYTCICVVSELCRKTIRQNIRNFCMRPSYTIFFREEVSFV